MTDIVKFYGKPKCINNRRQIGLFQEAGVALEIFDLLKQPWTQQSLTEFFGDRPLEQCINRSAPAVKNGELDPSGMTDDQLLEAMCADPILIRRPLIAHGETRFVGFDWEQLCAHLNLASAALKDDLETCAREQANELS